MKCVGGVRGGAINYGMAFSHRLLTPWLVLPLAALLSGCLPTLGVRNLNFRPDAGLTQTDAASVLVTQRVAAAQLTSIPEALRRAPPGSVIVACWQDTDVSNFWGPCSHITRKLSDSTLADTWPSRGANEYPISLLYARYAVIVLDEGVTDEQMPALRAELRRVRGRPYNLSGQNETFYCSNLQNQLNHAIGKPDVVPRNQVWNAFIPAEALLQPGARVLWVGVRGFGSDSAPAGG